MWGAAGLPWHRVCGFCHVGDQPGRLLSSTFCDQVSADSGASHRQQTHPWKGSNANINPCYLRSPRGAEQG